MESVPFPPRPEPVITFSEAVFFTMLAMFLVVVCVWPILTGRILHFSTWTPDVLHSYALHDRGVTYYVKPALGRFYVSLPWLWCSLLAATVLTGLLTGKKDQKHK